MALTLLLAAILFGYAQHWHRSRGSWWPPVLIAAIALAAGVKLG